MERARQSCCELEQSSPHMWPALGWTWQHCPTVFCNGVTLGSMTRNGNDLHEWHRCPKSIVHTLFLAPSFSATAKKHFERGWAASKPISPKPCGSPPPPSKPCHFIFHVFPSVFSPHQIQCVSSTFLPGCISIHAFLMVFFCNCYVHPAEYWALGLRDPNSRLFEPLPGRHGEMCSKRPVLVLSFLSFFSIHGKKMYAHAHVLGEGIGGRCPCCQHNIMRTPQFPQRSTTLDLRSRGIGPHPYTSCPCCTGKISQYPSSSAVIWWAGAGRLLFHVSPL